VTQLLRSASTAMPFSMPPSADGSARVQTGSAGDGAATGSAAAAGKAAAPAAATRRDAARSARMKGRRPTLPPAGDKIDTDRMMHAH